MSFDSNRHVAHDTQRVSRLIGLIYEAASKPSRWPATVEAIARDLDLRAAHVQMATRTPDGEVVAIPVAWGLTQEDLARYEEHFAAIDPHTVAARGTPSGSVFTYRSIVPDEELLASRYYKEFYAPAGLRHGFVALISTDGPDSSFLACHRGLDQPPPSEEDLELLRLLLPHLQAARLLAIELGTLHDQRRMTFDMLDRIPAGLIFVDEAGEILHTNRPAQTILDQKDGLAARADGLEAERAEDTRAVRDLIEAAVSMARDRERTAVTSIRLPRPSGARPLDVTVLPVDPDTRAWSRIRAAACVLVSDGEPRLDGVAQRLVELYGLSRIEAGLAVAIASGATVRDWAEHRGVSVETVRWQLKQVFAKTGTVRQPDLMRLVLMGPGLVR